MTSVNQAKTLHVGVLCIYLLSCLLFTAISFTVAAQPIDYKEVEWTDLMPEDDLEALMNPPEFLWDIQDGSAEDSLDAFGQKKPEDEQSQRFQEALTSTRVIEDFDQAAIRIPGFVVPLDVDAKQRVTEFFIVPYFGACLHLPPPPPNQMIYAVVDKGIDVTNLYEPFWFEGILEIKNTSNMTGASAYSLQINTISPYDD